MIELKNINSNSRFNNIRVSKKIQRTYEVNKYTIDKFWDDVIYSEEEEETTNEKNSKYKRYKKDERK